MSLKGSGSCGMGKVTKMPYGGVLGRFWGRKTEKLDSSHQNMGAFGRPYRVILMSWSTGVT